MDSPLVRPGLTYEDLLALPHRGQGYEIFDGELFASPVPSLPHQRTAKRLARAFDFEGEALWDETLAKSLDLLEQLADKAWRITGRAGPRG